jgi:hypothetical protein
MDDLDPVFGLFLAVTVICAIVYVVALIILVAMIAVPCLYLGKKFYQQITQRYRVTLISAWTLALVGICSLMLVFSLLKTVPQYQGTNWIYLLTIPIFLGLAIVTLGLWGLAKNYPIWAATWRAEKLRREGSSKLRRMDKAVDRVNREIEVLDGCYSSLLHYRREMEDHLRLICTAAGDQRLHILQKEALEKSLIRHSETELKARLNRLRSMPEPGPEYEMEICLLEIGMTDLQSDHAHARRRHYHKELASLESLKRQFSENQQTLEQQLQDARAALTMAQSQRIVLD